MKAPYLIIPIISGMAIFTAFRFQQNSVEAEIKKKETEAAVNLPPPNPLKNVYYGELHLHTTQSFDAYTFGTRIGPEEAYKLGRGEAIQYLGQPLKRQPLDFLAVTDHSENIGVLSELNDTTSVLSQSELGKNVRKGGASIYSSIRDYFFKDDYSTSIPGFDNKAISASAWQRQVKAANDHYQPGKFTTFIAYEWTSAPDRHNLHRNVIFKNTGPNRPFSSIDSKRPEDLWTFLENQRKQGNEGLAIPHNANASNGWMYDWNDSDGKPIDQRYAERRVTNEPVNEVSQNKGQSETHPALSTNDEFANFEIVDFMSPNYDSVRQVQGSYVRDAFGRGLEISQKVGANPFKFGVIGASDLHGAVSHFLETEYVGAIGSTKKDPKEAVTYKKGAPLQTLYFGSGNIAGVWAEQNTREGIYDAIRRKETFATTGTRIKFRFFGGWNLTRIKTSAQDWIQHAYKDGVPMGGDLPAKSASVKAPSFVAWAVKDPNGANLDRIQVIKVWAENGTHKEKIYDIALADNRKPDPKTGKVTPVGNTVDLKTGTYKNDIGDTELSGVWSDPDFNPSFPAVYYLRVLEIPTPRWSTIVAAKNGLPIPEQVAATIQERGWSSPIWYTPSK